MTVETFTPKKFDPTVRDIVHEAPYRDVRIIQTRDPRWVGQADAFGFKLDCGFVIRDELDEIVYPSPAMAWFYTPYDAIAAIETVHTILPMEHPRSTAAHEYNRMYEMRQQQFWRFYNAMQRIQKACEDARDFDDNPTEDVLGIIAALKQAVGER
jgi:hypothetical protein